MCEPVYGLESACFNAHEHQPRIHIPLPRLHGPHSGRPSLYYNTAKVPWVRGCMTVTIILKSFKIALTLAEYILWPGKFLILARKIVYCIAKLVCIFDTKRFQYNVNLP